MKAVVKKVGEPAEVVEIENTLKAYQDAVGGHFQTLPFGALFVNFASCGKGDMEEAKVIEGVILLCDEEGHIKNKPLNFEMPIYDGIFGDVVFVGDGAEDFRDLTDEETEGVMKKLNKEEK